MHVSAAGLRYVARDEDLRTKVFRCDDPEGLDRLLGEPVKDGDTPEIEFQYDVTPKVGVERPYIRCAHCGYPNHWRGFVMQHASGARILVGKDCGESLYGASFVRNARDFDQLATRQIQLARLEEVMRAFGPFLGYLAALAHHESVDQVRRLLSDMEAGANTLLRQLQAAARHNSGGLTVVERQRDLAAEAKRTSDKGKPIYVDQTREVGRLAGWTLFRATGEMLPDNIRNTHDTAKVWFNVLIEKRSTDHWTADGLRKLFAGLNAVIDAVENQLEVMTAYKAVVHPSNLLMIAEWASLAPRVPGTWSANPSQLVWKKDSGAVSVIDITPPSAPLDWTPFMTFRRAVRMERVKSPNPPTDGKESSWAA
nr:hypothetical protein [uncultured Rhodopila sp.]